MTPKEKAEELITKFKIILMTEDTECGNEILCTIISKQCALIAVNEILDDDVYDMSEELFEKRIEYWEQVKEQIENLMERTFIDFGVAERILKGENSIVKTTGYHSHDFFSGIYLQGDMLGYTSNGFIKSCAWEDITDTYNA